MTFFKVLLLSFCLIIPAISEVPAATMPPAGIMPPPNTSQPAGEVVGLNKDEVQAVAEPIIETMLAGLNTNNYTLFSQYFDDRLKRFYFLERFTNMQRAVEKLGASGPREFIGFINQTPKGPTVVTWKIHYPDASPSPCWLLISVVFSKHGASAVVVNFR